LIRALTRHGVRQVFSLCGDHINAAYDACLDYGVRIVDVRHESAAAHMADGWARMTRQPGVCLVTGGPGHTNAVTGVATACLAGSPMLAISGHHDYGLIDRAAMQELDQVGLMRPITKWARLVHDARRIPEYVSAAFHEAWAGRPGPVHLSITEEAMLQAVDEAEAAPAPAPTLGPARPAADAREVARAIAHLRGARRPAIIAGSGVWWSGAEAELGALVERTRVPVFTIGLARGAVSDDHPLCFGYADPVLNDTAKALRRADVVLVIGKRFDFRLGFGGPRMFDPAATLIQVDIDPREIGRNRPVQVPIAADAREALRLLAGEAEAAGAWGEPDWAAELRAARDRMRAAWAAGMRDGGSPVHPLRVCAEVSQALTPETTIAIDGGDFTQFCRMLLPARRPGRWIRLGGLATLGAALPLGLAAKLARPAEPVVILMGDGGLGFYAMELDTAARHRLPVVVIVGNDRGWGMERNIQAGTAGPDRVVGCELGDARYGDMARALGCDGEQVEKADDVGPAIRRALESGRPTLLDVRTRGLASPITEQSIAKRRR
jgi:acetolactate synthase-1/2/3 large subunit